MADDKEDIAVLTSQVQGAKRFIIELLETTAPTRPVSLVPTVPQEEVEEEEEQEQQEQHNHGARMMSQIRIKRRKINELKEARSIERGDPRALKKCAGTLYDLLPGDLKTDREIALAGFVGEHVKLEDLPAPWNQDRDFFLAAVKRNFRVWFRIPQPFPSDPDFIRHLSVRTDNMVGVAFEQNPDLSENCSIWDDIIGKIKAVKRSGWYEAIRCLREPPVGGGGSERCTLFLAPQTIRANKELMIKACSKDVAELLRVDASLLSNRDFLSIVLKAKPLGLLFLTTATQLAFPDLVEELLADFVQCDSLDNATEELAEILDPSFFQRPTFPKAWFCSGAGFIADKFPASWSSREDIFLWIAKHNYQVHDNFQHASNDLKTNLSFMIQATEYNCSLFDLAPEEFQKDYELVVRHIGHGWSAQRYVTRESTAEWRAWIDQLMARLDYEIKTHDKFVEFFLSELADTEAARRSQSKVRLLKQDPETTFMYKKLVADYLGIPVGSRYLPHLFAWDCLRKAIERLDQD